MFDFVRKHTKIMMSLMFLLIIPGFVLVGVDGFFDKNSSSETVAKVGSKTITQAQWDAAHKRQVDNIRASSPGIDPKTLDSAAARYATLESLVHEYVVDAAIEDMHLSVSDERLKQIFLTSPDFAALRRPDGSLDVEKYAQIAAGQGLTPQQLDARIKQQIAQRYVETAITSTSFVTPGKVNLFFNAYFQQREVQVVSFSPASYVGKLSPKDSDLESYYQAHTSLFALPQTVDIEYLVLDMDAAKKSVNLSEQDLKAYYEQNADRLSEPEERRASHILINAPKSMSGEERVKARAQAQGLLDQIKKKPSSFAELARKNSQDTGSAASGGDLGFFARGAMVKPFEDAAFSLDKGAVSDLVESDFGYHIIQVTDLKSPQKKTFDMLRTKIETDLRAQQAQRKFAEMVETFSNGVYEQSSDLQGIAKKLMLNVKTATQLQSKPAPGAGGVLANPKLLAALFSPDSIEKKHNTEAIEFTPNQWVSARVIRHTPARTQPLADVRAQVREKWLAEESLALAKKEGTAQLEAWKKQPDSAKLPAAVVVSRTPQSPVQEPLLSEVMRMPAQQLPTWAGVDLGDKGYAVVRLNKVLPRVPPTEEAAKQETAQYAKIIANAENEIYFEMLKERYKAVIKVPRPTEATRELAQ